MRAASKLIAFAVVGALARVAAADSHDADAEFNRGRALMKQKKLAAACEAFEHSYQLDPSNGTLFNLADCEAQLGKLASALARYRTLADGDSNAERRSMSAQLAKDLAARMPKLLITVPGHPANVSLSIDGTAATAQLAKEVPVDPGSHIVVVTAPGFAPWHESIDASRAGVVENVVVHLESNDRDAGASGGGAQPAGGREPDDFAPSSPRHTAALYTLIGGGVMLAGGLTFGGLAYSQWQHAQSCTGCDRASESHSAAVRGDVSTVLVATGAIAAAIGAYLWLTPTSHAAVAPAVAPGGGGVTLVGSF